MKISEAAKASDTSLTQGVLYALRYWLGGRRRLIAAAVLAVVGGAVLSWGWLVAAGIAPLMLAVLPCVAMCALGLCANKMGGKSCSNEQNKAKVVDKKIARGRHDGQRKDQFEKPKSAERSKKPASLRRYVFRHDS